MANLYMDQRKLVQQSSYSLSSHQAHFTVMILSQMAIDLRSCIMCYFHQFFWILKALLARMHNRFSSKWLMRSSQIQLQCCSGNFLNKFCVLHPNNAPENDADNVQIYIQVSKHKTTLNYWAKILSGEKPQVSYSG